MTTLKCRVCGADFVKRAPHHVNCSIRCGKRVYMRTYRVSGKGKYGRGCTR